MLGCLIFPYGGGGSKWIDLSLREFDVQWLVILADETNQKGFLDEARQIAIELTGRESTIPAPKQRIFSVLAVPSFSAFADLLAYLRALHQVIESRGYDAIFTHLDSGLMRWRIALYQCAEEFADLVKKIYIFNKLTAEIEQNREAITPVIARGRQNVPI